MHYGISYIYRIQPDLYGAKLLINGKELYFFHRGVKTDIVMKLNQFYPKIKIVGRVEFLSELDVIKAFGT